ncbi:hypothetical protein CEUSTIGMA_g11968.t1 [Chlamydomonas eustigma]|uniref:Uncharacterized protein n=1 Tax=Chlamydomonas eustigma TaxID=1157962 RepID=A0A250XN97_9CHLO|nr:hypothetical protein CEUSTIGMA_g11968.t1 [Chlamydomonas eustigma]|eukprot:GAX84547.1 hypothetical protein CEUSTIGMA_g11968.t1 [Chlamydomonas eustigma]
MRDPSDNLQSERKFLSTSSTTRLVTSIQQGALPKGINSQEVPSAGSTDGSVMPLNNPLMTQEINMTFLKLVTRALLEWLKDQTRSFYMTDEEVQAYIKSYPLMRQLLSVHDTQPATSGFFAQAWFYKGLKAGKGIIPNCFGGKQTWDAKFMMSTCKAASAAWVYFEGAEGLTDHYALGHAKAKQLLQNDAYRQAALQPFDRSSFVAGVARGMSSAAELKDDGYPKAIPVLSIHY